MTTAADAIELFGSCLYTKLDKFAASGCKGYKSLDVTHVCSSARKDSFTYFIGTQV